MTEMDIPVVKLDDDEIRKFDEYFDELRQEEAKWVATVLGNLAVATVVTGVISAALVLNENYILSKQKAGVVDIEAYAFPALMALGCAALSVVVYWRGKITLRKGYEK